LLTEQTNTQEH